MADAASAPSKLRLTDQTLAEQLKITDREIEERKALMGFSDDDARFLEACKPVITEHIDDITGEFYEKQIKIPEIQLIIGDSETFRRLHGSMKRYILELFDGYYDGEYVNKRLRIGRIHNKIGVPPKLYISAICLLESILNKYVLAKPKSDAACEDCSGRQDALHRLLMFDIQFVFDTYIASLVSEVEAAKDQVERYAAGLEETVAERTQQLQELSRRDTLTGLFNQRSFYEQLRRELSVAERNHHPVSLVYFDLNNFKKLNDSQGHKAGDDLLETVGKAVNETIRDIDVACRYGGDEFCIIMPNTAEDQAEEVCKRLIADFDGRPTQGVTFSVGIAQLGPETYSDMNTFVRAADEHMYVAKARSKEDPGHHISVAGG